ncbi:MAG: hypothetical protein AAGG75_25580 [Bacteroidota bacterium]
MDGLKSYFSSIDPILFKHVSGTPKAFIDKFREQEYLSEQVFAEYLYGGEYDENSYREWKSRTLRILQALAIISNTKGGSLVKKKYDECQKKITVGQKILTSGGRKEGMRLIKQAYLIATEYDFSHLACELASILHYHHTYYHRNKRMVGLYAQKVRKHLKDYTAEKEAESYFYQIVVEQTHSSIPLDFLREAVQNLNDQKGDSIKYKFFQASINVLYHLCSGKYKDIILVCEKVLNFFEHRKGVYPAYYLFFLKNRGTAQTATRDFAKASESYQAAEQYTTNSPYNTYMIRFYRILNELHAGNYQAAYDRYQKSKRCKFEDIRQHFVIIEAYLCFLASMGYLQLNKIFRIGKYLNDTFKAQEDKQGSNINILIAELLVYLARDRGKFIDRIEAVQHYSYRHLKSPDTQRAKWFIKILCLLAHPKVNFHPVALQRKAKRYIELLKSHPVRMGEGFAVEIIPFDKLVEMISLQLKKKVA